MILSKEEAIIFVLNNSENQKIYGKTKLNKLVARLNLFFIPVDLEFSLNKYGSDCDELRNNLEDTPFYKLESNDWGGVLALTPEGKGQYRFIEKKIVNTYSLEECAKIKNEIHKLSKLNYTQISEDEHELLVVDVDNRFKLDQKLNVLTCELKDLYDESSKIEEKTFADVYFKGLIEFNYNLVKYLRHKKFKRLEETEYDLDAYMKDYYFIKLLELRVIPFLKEQKEKAVKDKKPLKQYHEIIECMTKDYPFSIHNKDLDKLLVYD